jgi:hypothetical protein
MKKLPFDQSPTVGGLGPLGCHTAWWLLKNSLFRKSKVAKTNAPLNI